MITLKDIFKAVCEHITTNTNIPLADADMEEPVIRPSFKIFMDTAKSGLYSSALRQVRVYYLCIGQHVLKNKVDGARIVSGINSLVTEKIMLSANELFF